MLQQNTETYLTSHVPAGREGVTVSCCLQVGTSDTSALWGAELGHWSGGETLNVVFSGNSLHPFWVCVWSEKLPTTYNSELRFPQRVGFRGNPTKYGSWQLMPLSSQRCLREWFQTPPLPSEMKNQDCCSRFNLIFTFIADIQVCGLKGQASIKNLTETAISFFSSSHLSIFPKANLSTFLLLLSPYLWKYTHTTIFSPL